MQGTLLGTFSPCITLRTKNEDKGGDAESLKRVEF